ncbi:MAG: hypothetical protein EB027_08170, partial [Actinobacteria bacterium]|nr:hypothetical protein [Actinomycetota bacterium]
SSSSTTLAATDTSNALSGSGSDLYVYVNQGTMVIEPKISGTSSLVVNGPATLSLRPKYAANSYSGGTFVNAGTLNLQVQAGSGFVAIPGDLTVNNAAVTMSTEPQQIAAASNIAINGGGSVTLANYTAGPTQTFASLSFNNQGGIGNPTFSFGTPTTATSTVVLTAANAITAINDSFSTTPVISTGAASFSALQLSNAAPVITVSGLSSESLVISAPITSAGGQVKKSGAGALVLSGASTFTNGFDLNAGVLIIGAASTGTPVTSGPIGTGTLQVDVGTTLLSDAGRTLGNAVTVTGNFTFGGVTAANNLTLAGAVDLGSAGRTITVSSPAVTATLTGVLTSTATGTAL